MPVVLSEWMVVNIKTRRAHFWSLTLVAVLAVGCGGSRGGAEGDAGASGVPPSLPRAESAAEDSIDLVLAGKRDKVVKMAGRLDDLANGDLPRDLQDVASADEIKELQSRTADFVRIAPDGEPVAVGLAANRAFELIAGFFGRYETKTPGEVLLLDYYDFEAKLQALAHDMAKVRATVDRMAGIWLGLDDAVRSHRGGSGPADAFDAHVAAMERLTTGSDFPALVKEAQHGLDLVDELEHVFVS